MRAARNGATRSARRSRPRLAGRVGSGRVDAEYVRHGSANCFIAVAPQFGWRHVAITARRTAVDWAHAMRDLVDVQLPDAERIVLVLDDLNTHDPASLYKAFPPAEAKRIWDKLEFHFTPKHGSWLNMAELELSVLARQFLARRLPDRLTLAAEAAAWAADRNAAHVAIDWRFTTTEARVRLPHLYPLLPSDES